MPSVLESSFSKVSFILPLLHGSEKTSGRWKKYIRAARINSEAYSECWRSKAPFLEPSDSTSVRRGASLVMVLLSRRSWRTTLLSS